MRFAQCLVILALGLSVLFFQACSSRLSFSSVADSAASTSSSGDTSGSTSSSSTCTVSTTSESLRIIFMVDNSGSTADTDPSEYYRITAVQNFLSAYGSNANFTYGFGYFAGDSAYLYDASTGTFSSNASSPFGSASFLSAALTAYENVPDDGDTPYQAAFQTVQSAISKDSTTSNYVLIFMSDGGPTDLNSPIDTSIVSIVDNLKTITENKGHLITVSSVYFGPDDDSDAKDHLEVMASEGGGQFFDTNTTTELEVDDIITVPGCDS